MLYTRELLDKYKADVNDSTKFVSSLGYNSETYTLYLNITNATGLSDLNISYNVKFDHWVILHDWATSFIASNHKITISPSRINNGTLIDKLYLHNQYNRPGLYYYDLDGIAISLKDSFVDTIFTNDLHIMKQFASFMIHSKIIKNDYVNVQLPASFIIIYNDYQCTEKIALVAGDGFFDDQKLLTSNVNKNSIDWFDKSNFISNFIIVRVGYTNADGNIFIHNGIVPKYNILK